MQKTNRTLLITGANRGLGLGVIENLCKSNPLNLSIIMAGRSQEKTEQVIDRLKKQYPECKIEFLQLDVADFESQQKMITILKERKIIIDILVNNAGVFIKTGDRISQDILQVNFFGTVEFTKQITPYLSLDAKIIQLSSTGGLIQQLKLITLVQKFLQQSDLTEEEIFQFANDYIADSKRQPDYDIKAYHASKSLLNAWARWVGTKQLLEKQSMYLICPGWVKTDMGGPNAPLSIEEGIYFIMEIINKFPFEKTKNSGKMYKHGQNLGF